MHHLCNRSDTVISEIVRYLLVIDHTTLISFPRLKFIVNNFANILTSSCYPKVHILKSYTDIQ